MGTERKSSYEAPNEELIAKFTKACMTAGASSSGLVVDLMAGPNLAYMGYLKGVVLARLDGVAPSFEPDQQVRVIAPDGIRGSWKTIRLPKGHEYKVSRVWYVEKQWFLELHIPVVLPF